MIKKRPILDIIDLVKDKERFSKEPPELQDEIFKFFRNSRNLKRKQEKVRKLEILITKEKNNIKKLSKDKTKGFVYITDELNRSNYFPYSYFEDMAFHRDDLLSSLFG